MIYLTDYHCQFKLIVTLLPLFSTAVDGVVIYLTDYQRSITERLAKASRVASSQGSTCRRCRWQSREQLPPLVNPAAVHFWEHFEL